MPNIWYKVWSEAGRPSTGVLSDIKKNSKRKCKSHVRELKCKQNKLYRERLAKSFAEKGRIEFCDFKEFDLFGTALIQIWEDVAVNRLFLGLI